MLSVHSYSTGAVGGLDEVVLDSTVMRKRGFKGYKSALLFVAVCAALVQVWKLSQ